MSGYTFGIFKTSKASTNWYVRQLELAKIHVDKVPVYDGNFDAINDILPHPSGELDEMMLRVLLPISEAHVLIPNVTLHETVDRLVDAGHALPRAVHPYALAIERLPQNRPVILFGSRYTMTSDYGRAFFKNNHVELAIMDQDDMMVLDALRRKVYADGISSDEISAFDPLVHKYQKIGTIILACTELSMMGDASELKVLDMAKLQVEGAIKLI